MKIPKSAAATARRLFGFCQTGGRLDEERLRQVAARLIQDQPRDDRAVMAALLRLAKLDAERRRVTVESAVALDAATRERIMAGLSRQYGADLVATYQVVPELLGGLRIRVGDDVIDGSVSGRLERLANAF